MLFRGAIGMLGPPMRPPRFAVLAALTVLACGPSAPTKTPVAPPRDFGQFVEDYFAAKYAYKPTSGTSVGFHQYDAKLEDWSRTRIEQRIAELGRPKSDLATVDRSKLSFDDAIDATALENAIEGELLDLSVIREWSRNPMGYAGLPGRAINGLMKRDFAPAKDRLVPIVQRLRQIPSLYAAGKANLDNPPKEMTDLAIRMAKGSIGFFEKTVPNWAKSAGAGPEFEDANEKAIAATKDFVAFLEKDLLPRSKGKYALGEELFRKKLRYEEMIDLPLSDLLARGEAQLAKDYAAFVATAQKIDPKKTPAEVMKALSDDHPSENDLVNNVASSLEDARKYVVEKDLATLPSDVRPKVEETPPFARAGTFASMDTPGAFETNATEAFYYVTPVEKDWDDKHKEEHLRLFNPPIVAMINVHEAFPGHYLQFLWGKQLPTKTRKLVYAGSNAEGWAHYSEQMMVDQGFGGGSPKVRLAQLQEALLRDCRYVVGVKLHTQGMSVEDGAKIFEEKGFQEKANAYEEARRGAWNPTYLVYTYGKLDIQALAAEYMKTKGATLKQFHDAFVSQGALPIPLVRKILFRAGKKS